MRKECEFYISSEERRGEERRGVLCVVGNVIIQSTVSTGGRRAELEQLTTLAAADWTDVE